MDLHFKFMNLASTSSSNRFMHHQATSNMTFDCIFLITDFEVCRALLESNTTEYHILFRRNVDCSHRNKRSVV